MLRVTNKSSQARVIVLAYFLLLLSCLPLSASESSFQPQLGESVFFNAHTAAQRLPRIHSLLISHRGDLVVEQYYNNTDPTRAANMKSASKSVISALVGIAIEQGLISGVEQTIDKYFPQLVDSQVNPSKRGITIEDLLTMRSGLETTSNRNYGKWVISPNWVQFVLDQPLVAEPGSRMIYSTGNTHLLSAILTKLSHSDTKTFAQNYLTRALGFSLNHWPTDPQGIYFGGNDLEMTPRQMLKFGELYLNEGRYQGTQIVPRKWVQVSVQPHAISPRGQGRFYGYGWWIRDLAGMQVPIAWGYGGQLIFIVDEYDLVIVSTSDSTPGSRRRNHLRRIYQLVEDYILVPVVSAYEVSSGH